MKQSIVAVFAFIMFFVFVSCDDNSEDELFCSLDQFQERLADIECLAEELVQGCKNVGCFSIESSIRLFSLDANCSVIDCVTLECDQILVGLVPDQISSSGELLDISLDAESGFPVGIFNVNDIESEFTCTVSVP